MESIKLLSSKREGHDQFSSATLQRARKAKVFDMYKGEESMVTLRASNRIADAVVDAFGQSIMMVPFDKESFTVNVLVEVSPTFFSWITNFGDNIEIANPPKIREKFTEYIKRILEQY